MKKLLILLACFQISNVMMGLTLTWRPPESGPEVAGYYIYATDVTSNNTFKTDVGNVTMYSVPNLVIGRTYVFYATAFNAHGLESDPSNTFTYVHKIKSPTLVGEIL